MFSIRKEYIKFINKTNNILKIIDFKSPEKLINIKSNAHLHLFLAGLINGIWQFWNKFWNNYWNAYFLGGLDIDNNRILKSNTITNLHHSLIRPVSLKDEYDVAYYLLYILGKRRRHIGRLIGTYQFPTWGDIDIIQDLSIKIIFPGHNILSVMGALGHAPKHLQEVRNASIHMDKDSINNLKRHVIPYYSISNIKYPTEIIFSEEIFTRKYALQSWIDDLIAFIQLI
jgi:hypothetical protein